MNIRNPPITGFAVAIAGLFLAVLPYFSIGDEWHIETLNPDGVGYKPDMPSLALDSMGIPHLSYICLALDYDTQLRYMFWNGEDWLSSVIDEFAYGWDSHIKLDSLDRPHISYSPNEYDIMYAHFNGEEWVNELVNPVLYSFYQSSLALDSQDNAHITFRCLDWNTGYMSLVYAYKQNDEWINETVDNSSESVGYGSCITLDSEDYLHISYYDFANQKMKYAHWTGSAWDISVVDDAVDNAYYGTSLAIDQQNNPHISYCKNYNLYYAYWDGTGWNIQLVDDTPNTGYSSSLAIDSLGRPHISYAYYQSPNHYIKYAYFDGANWQIENVVKQCDEDGPLLINSLALNNADQPYIAYAEYINQQFTLKLAWQGDGFGLAINLLSFTATPKENSIALNWQVEATEGEQIAGFNLYRREITFVAESYSFQLQKKDAGWTKINPSLITGENPCAYTDSTVEPGKAYEYKLEAVLADQSAQTLGTCQATTGQSISFAITKLYPNPASDVLNLALNLPQSGEVKLELYDISGRIVLSKDIQISTPGGFTEQLDVSGLSSGVYTLRATQNGAEAVARMVVVR